MMKHTPINYLNISFVILAFVLGITFEKVFNLNAKPVESSDTTLKEVRLGGYQLIRPLLRCENETVVNSKEIEDLKNKIIDLTDTYKKAGDATQISVYFRYPRTVNWFSINSEEKYTPASLMKVPVMMMFYRNAANEPALLEEKLTFQTTPDMSLTYYTPSKRLEHNQVYTIGELIDRMIRYSDNDAKDLLLSNVNLNEYSKVFDDIQLPAVDFNNQENFITVDTYAKFFRTIFNGSFLSKRLSETAMESLTKVEFNKGITAGVPPSTQVAHKFGESIKEVNGEHQLHDCGFVYLTEDPYLLCIMTKGNSFAELEGVIQRISLEIYQNMKTVSVLE